MGHCVVSYPDVINFLLDKCSRNETIFQTQDGVKNLQNLSNQRASDFDDYIRSETKRCGSAYRPVNRIEIFTHGIAHQIHEQTTRYWPDYPDIDLDPLARFANGLHYAIYQDANDSN